MKTINKKIKTHLYLNNIDIKFNTNKNKLFLGNWCFFEKDFPEIVRNKKFKILDDVWKKKHAFNYDYKLCDYLVDIFITKIGKFLNSTNKIKFSKRHWKIILLPWLSRYLSVQLYRWRAAHKACSQADRLFIYELNKYQKIIPNDTWNFIKLIQDDDQYNYYNFLKIFQYLKKKKFKINFIPKKTSKKKNNKKKINIKNYIFDKFLSFLKKINIILSKNNSILFESELLKKIIYLNFCYKLKLIPQFFINIPLDENIFNDLKYNLYLRNKFKKFNNNKIDKKYLNDQNFIDFLYENILHDLPKCFVEGFENLIKKSKEIKQRPKLIFTGFNYLYNETFKVWLADYVTNNNCKLFICDHGGGGVYKYEPSLNIPIRIAEKYITYVKPNNFKEIQLTPLKFIDIKKNETKSSILIYAASPNHKYQSTLLKNYCKLNNYQNILAFNKYLKLPISKKLLYLPAKNFLRFEEIKIKNILEKRFVDERSVLYKYAQISKLIVCSYPETAFLESIYTRPTILICKKEDINLKHNEETNILDKLKKNKILFFNAKDAALHINNIWLNPDKWWNSKNVKKTIEEVKYIYANVNKKNPLLEWINFIKKEKIMSTY